MKRLLSFILVLCLLCGMGSALALDLPGGDGYLLVTSIKDKLLTLPDTYSVRPGHGIASTIGKERQHNPYLR